MRVVRFGQMLRAMSPTHAPVTFDSPPPSAKFSVDIPQEMLEAMTGNGSIAPRISRELALQVPAVLRARNLIAGTLGGLPHHVHDPDRNKVTGTQYLLTGNIDPDIPNTVVLANTYEDLFFEPAAWWRVTDFGWHGYPVHAQHVPVGSVHVAQTTGLLPSQARISPDQPFPPVGQVYIDGYPVRDEEIIRLDSPNPPFLRHAARAVRSALLLDKAAALHALGAPPIGVFTPTEGVDPGDEDEIQAYLDDFEAKRGTNAYAYVGAALKLQALGWNPEQMQFAEQRQHAVLEIARAAGIDPEDLGVSTTSRTYQNGSQRRLDMIDFTLASYVSAVRDRLSMRDVLPRGYETDIDFRGFVRADEKTRMETYWLGRQVGAYTREEIREEENRPVLPEAQLDPPAPTGGGGAPDVDSPTARQEAGMPAETFTTDTETSVSFDGPEVAETFRVNREKRTISGLAVPWGKVARSGFSRWRFPENSLRWSDARRVKLNLHHDPERAIGYALGLRNTTAGLDVTFKIADVPEGDKALALAEGGVLDGLSIEIDFEDGDGWKPDPSDESVRLVSRAKLRGVALTAMPAYDDARVADVAASRDKEQNMTDTVTAEPTTAEAAEFNFDGYMKGLADSMTESYKDLTKSLGDTVSDSLTTGFKTALESLPSPQEGPHKVRAARFVVTREAPVYSLTGGGHSMVRDAYYAATQRDEEALARLRKYRLQTEEVAKLASSALAGQQFATATTVTDPEIIPPGYRPDLYVPQLAQERPLVSLCSRGTIENASPFTVPVFTSITTGSADHVEGTNPTDGTLAFGSKTVAPLAISGLLKLSREIVDSSNPAIDAIAVQAMREAYSQQTEVKVYTMLNGTAGAGGTITGDNVPSGAQASTIVAAATDDGSQALAKHIRERLAKYPFQRFGSPSGATMGQNGTVRLATANDDTGRPLFPSVGATNTAGVGNAVQQGWNIDGLPFLPSWSQTGVAAGDSQIFIIRSTDVWVWESPLLSFRYEERSGPALIELAMFGYFGAHVLRPVGLSGIRITLV